jgi:hypothetical protein
MRTVIESVRTTVERPGVAFGIDEAPLAAVSFLARYSGRTLEAYRHDLRGYFRWASDKDIAVLEATRPHIELFRAWMEDRGLAASTIDRRLSTVCSSSTPPRDSSHRDVVTSRRRDDACT